MKRYVKTAVDRNDLGSNKYVKLNKYWFDIVPPDLTGTLYGDLDSEWAPWPAQTDYNFNYRDNFNHYFYDPNRRSSIPAMKRVYVQAEDRDLTRRYKPLTGEFYQVGDEDGVALYMPLEKVQEFLTKPQQRADFPDRFLDAFDYVEGYGPGRELTPSERYHLFYRTHDPDVIRELAHDKSSMVRRTVAGLRKKETPDDVLYELAEDQDATVREAARDHLAERHGS